MIVKKIMTVLLRAVGTGFLCGLATTTFAQYFSGRLIYHYVAHDSIQRKVENIKLNLNANSAYTLTRTVWVKKDSMRHVTANDCGRSDWVSYQFGKKYYTNMSHYVGKSKTYERLVMPNLPKVENSIILIEKGKNVATILGYDCREYVYKYVISLPPDSEKNIISRVWIPLKLKFKKQYNYGNDFGSYFMPEGLVFKREVYTNGELKRSCELTNILFYDVPNDQFEDCEEVIKEND
jgi:hypothetical protein